MKNFEKDNFKSADTGIVGFMIRVDDDRQLLRFCRDGMCTLCLFAPENYQRKFGAAQQGCYRNKMDYLYRDVEQ
ncbi:hypothetical protein D1155_10890 [Anaerotruncus sp. 80]|uniref:Uncharacterized protein n=1 Tax=Anaerotruncus colihominis TaxID=169435 RepID=A0A845QN82_9FIRM|nr:MULTISPECIES: hypothetical protein [Clostridia]NBH62157.1 hypothetical protein [Anaerotruncus colihominis]NCE99643.1 hypothetical protein [Emergencia sp. 1XD21-10]NCF02812.1 hypothetical protein [Anaerotruncus sp. 80]